MRRVLCALFLFASVVAAQNDPAHSAFSLTKAMIPMRDGVHLETVIIAPVNQAGPLPILLERTPYGVPDKAPAPTPARWVELAHDGYIFVVQNLRGRFKSEGVFLLSS